MPASGLVASFLTGNLCMATAGPRKGHVTLACTRTLLASSGILTSLMGSATLRLPLPSLETSLILLSPIEDLPWPPRRAIRLRGAGDFLTRCEAQLYYFRR